LLHNLIYEGDVISKNNPSKLVHYWADNHLIVTGNLYQLIDNQTNQLLYSTVSSNNDEAEKRCGVFLRKASESRYFCESLFWASQPKQAAKT